MAAVRFLLFGAPREKSVGFSLVTSRGPSESALLIGGLLGQKSNHYFSKVWATFGRGNFRNALAHLAIHLGYCPRLYINIL